MFKSCKGLGCRLVCVCIALAFVFEMLCFVNVACADRLGNGRRGRTRAGQKFAGSRTSVPSVRETVPETKLDSVPVEEPVSEQTVSAQSTAPVSSSQDTSSEVAPSLASRTDGTATPAVAPAPEVLPPAPCFWFTNWNAACQAATELKRPILLHFYATYCGPCKRMEETVFPNHSIQTLAGLNFVTVKLDGNQVPKLCSQLGIHSFPADVILLPTGKVIAKHIGFQDVPTYSAFLTAAINQIQLPAMSAPVGPNWKAQSQVAQANPAEKNPQAVQTLEVPALEPDATALDDGLTEKQSDEEATDLTSLGRPEIPGTAQEKKDTLPVAREIDLISMEAAPLSPSEEIPQELLEHRGVAENVTANAEVTHSSSDASKKSEIRPTSFHAGTKFLMDGYCPVSMVEKNEWVRGNENLTVLFEGGTYCFASEVEKEKFEQNPRFYALVSSGYDIVALTEADQKVEGSRRYGIRYGNMNFVFANPENREKFRTNPDFYAAKVQELATAKSTEVTR